MTIRSAAVFLVVVLAASRANAQFNAPDPAPGEQAHAELSLLFWTPTPQLQLNTGGLTNTGVGPVDFVGEFGIADKRLREYRMTAKPGRHHKLRYSSLPIKYEATATLNRSIQFGGLTVPVSTTATATLDWRLRRYGYEWDFLAMDRGYIGVITELKDNKVSATVASPFGTETAERRAVIPTVGIGARGYPHRLFSITGEFTGFKMPERFKDTLSGKFTDLDLYGTISLGRNVAVQGGYRSVLVEYASDGDTGNLRLKGLYWGGSLRF
jgi:hypothetical protein